MSKQSKPLNPSNPSKQANTSDRSKQLPFDIEHFLDVVGDASRRSRQFLLLLSFSTFLIFIAWQNSPVPENGWHQSRISLLSVVKEYLVLKGDTTDKTKLPQSIYDFIFQNEAKLGGQVLSRNDSAFVRNLNADHPTSDWVYLRLPNSAEDEKLTFAQRKAKYREIGKAVGFVVRNRFYTKKEIDEYYNQLRDKEIDHFMIIKVPILGVSFDVRYLGLYGTVVILTLYLLFYTSLKREYISLKTAFKRGWVVLDQHHYYFYEYMSMQQVFSIPPKLFVPKRENYLSKFSRWDINAIQSVVLSVAILVPCGLCWWVALAHFSSWHNLVATSFDPLMLLNLLFLILVSIIAINAHRFWKKMDYLWENQTYEFNFEYILECIGVDNEYDLRSFSENQLTEENEPDVKRLWYHLCQKSLKNGKLYASNEGSVKLLSQFIDNCLSREFVKAHYEESEVDKYWDMLIDWFKTKGRKNIGSDFRSSFNKMVNKMAKGV